MDKIDKEILKWHKKTFPKATFENQILKLEEENLESKKAWDKKNMTQYISELADIYIVSSVLWHRFESCIGLFYMNALWHWDQFHELADAVEEKMKINKKRVWKFENGVYRHEEKK
jgi:hypothetical protein